MTDRESPEEERLLTAIADPRCAGPLSGKDRELIGELLRLFEECVPAITQQDVMGLLVLRFWQEFLPVGKLTPEKGNLSILKGLAFVIKAEPERMQAAGFYYPPSLVIKVAPMRGREATAPEDLSECFDKRILHELALLVRMKWLGWYGEVGSPRREPRDDREKVIRGLARLHCFRAITGDEVEEGMGLRWAARKAKKLLSGYCRGENGGAGNVDAEDIVQELFVLDSDKLRRSKLLRLKEDGTLAYRPEAMMDHLRWQKYGTRMGANGLTTPSIVDPVVQLAIMDEWSRLVEGLRERQVHVLEYWDRPNIELARDMGCSAVWVGKLRMQIQARGKQLKIDLSE